MAEHLPSKEKVAGSNPVSRSRYFAAVVQLAERLVANEKVEGSNPFRRSNWEIVALAKRASIHLAPQIGLFYL